MVLTGLETGRPALKRVTGFKRGQVENRAVTYTYTYAILLYKRNTTGSFLLKSCTICICLSISLLHPVFIRVCITHFYTNASPMILFFSERLLVDDTPNLRDSRKTVRRTCLP